MSTSLIPKTTLIDFAKTPVGKYYGHPNHYALIIDDCFTPAECAELCLLAESTSGGWHEASIKKGEGRQEVEKNVRDCARILRDDPETAEMIFQRVKPFLEPVWEIGNPETGIISGTWRKKLWRMSRYIYFLGRKDVSVGVELILGGSLGRSLGGRLRFLKYGQGQFFQAHCDASYVPSSSERSFLTLHLYLNDSVSGDAGGDLLNGESVCEGGATRFWGQNMKDFVDVEAKLGRVLIFQHRNLLHSGELVTAGIKKTLRSDIIYKAVVAEGACNLE